MNNNEDEYKDNSKFEPFIQEMVLLVCAILFILIILSFFSFLAKAEAQDITIHEHKNSYYFRDKQRNTYINDEKIDTDKLKREGFYETREGTRIRRMYDNRYYIEEKADENNSYNSNRND